MNLYLFCELPEGSVFYLETLGTKAYMKIGDCTAISIASNQVLPFHPHILTFWKAGYYATNGG